MNNNFIAGQWVLGEKYRENVNPSDLKEIVGSYAQACVQDVDAAIAAAKASQPAWALAGPQKRSEALDFIGSELLRRKGEIGELLAREEGKTLPEATRK